jgi:hypothetical protein
MNLPIYRLDINEFDEETGIDFVSLVEAPAVERDFQAFNQEFVEPNKSESEDEFMSRCIKYVIDEGKETEQAIAICASIWDASNFAKISYDWDGVGSTAKGKEAILQSIMNGDEVYVISARDSKENIDINLPSDHIYATGSNEAKIAKIKELGITRHYDNNPDVVKALSRIGVKFETYSDYPQSAIDNAQRGMDLNEKVGNKCATLVGKARANQLINKENLSLETIKRTYSYLSRARAYYNADDTEACGTISYLLWGGDEMLRYCEKTLNMKSEKFAIQDEEKRIVSGVAMVADMPIYRRDAIRGEYYVVFDKESIFKIAKKWARSNKYDSVNAHHKTPIEEGVSLFESYIVDRERGVMPPKGYEDVADGSWFVSYLIDNDDVWAKVKAGEFKGFSVEGVFDFVSEVDEDLQVIEQLKRILSQWDGQ